MKNTLTDLNNHLFEQLERLNDEDLTIDELESEIRRSRAISTVAEKVIKNATVLLDATKFVSEYGEKDVPKIISGNNKSGIEYE